MDCIDSTQFLSFHSILSFQISVLLLFLLLFWYHCRVKPIKSSLIKLKYYHFQNFKWRLKWVLLKHVCFSWTLWEYNSKSMNNVASSRLSLLWKKINTNLTEQYCTQNFAFLPKYFDFQALKVYLRTLKLRQLCPNFRLYGVALKHLKLHWSKNWILQVIKS